MIVKTFIVRNNSTRNYNYKYYYDSIYIINPNYYYNILIETEEFQ